MILRNYDNIMLERRSLKITDVGLFSTVSTFGNGYVSVKKPDGVVIPLKNVANNCSRGPLSQFTENNNNTADTYGKSNLICGSGSTPEHYDDYTLESPFTTSQITSVKNVHKVEEPVYDETTDTWTFTYTRNYLANEDITVREIGVMTSVPGWAYVLVYRKVLETPLEVTAGKQFSLTFTVTLSANPNKPADYDASASVE